MMIAPIASYSQNGNQTAHGQLLYQGNFYRIDVTVENTQSGDVATFYRVVDQIRYGLPQQGVCNSQIITLNPRNQMAVNYNFTHYVTIPNYGDVYLTTK